MKVSLQDLPSLYQDSHQLADIGIDELKTIAGEYPYLQIAQLLVAKKDQQLSADGSIVDLQKLSLYFPDPIQLKSMLKKNESSLLDSSIPESSIEGISLPEPSLQESSDQDISQAGISAQSTETPDAKNFEDTDETPDAKTFEHTDETPDAKTFEQTQETADEKTFEHTEETTILVAATNTVHELVENALGLEEPISTRPLNPKNSVEIQEKEAAPINPTESKTPAKPDALPILFEPFYTIDYFASQGIKIKDDEPAKDKFSQQLKSFTEWIKTMRKLPQSEKAALSENSVDEKKVELMAMHSINDQQVETEAMAEVWEKQGNYQNAIVLYSKLSLHDPSKSAYFAAKIEHLKKLS